MIICKQFANKVGEKEQMKEIMCKLEPSIYGHLQAPENKCKDKKTNFSYS